MNEFNLNRFIKAQRDSFEVAYYELSNEKKESHWMWYIFPQLVGLGKSDTSIYYGINNLSEAKAYMKNEILGERLNLLVDLLLSLESQDPVKIFGFPDNLKLWSSLTLFFFSDEENPRFKKALDKFFQGRLEMGTVNMLKEL